MENMTEILSGWQAIAGYLGVEKTTAQRWEKTAGLPVKRLPGRKGGVFAYAEELQAWRNGDAGRRETEHVVEAAAEDRNRVRSGRQTVTFSVPVWALWASLVGVLAAGSVYWMVSGPGAPVSAYQRGPQLVMVDEHDREVGRYRLRNPVNPIRENSQLWAGDLSGEGEGLLYAESPEDLSLGNTLIFFSRRGRPVWQFRPGRAVKDLRTSYDAAFTIWHFRVLKEKQRGDRVAVESVHWWSYPAQVAVLDSKGKLLSEYLHSGHLRGLDAVDLDGTGHLLLLAVGVNNGFEAATLVLLDPDRMSGASAVPEGDIHKLVGLATGRERCVVLFPRSCVSKYDEFNIADEVRVVGGRIEVSVSEGISAENSGHILYQFDRHFRVIGVTLGSDYAGRHREMELAGKLDHPFDWREAQRLGEAVHVVWNH